jgi:hypothetical protein
MFIVPKFTGLGDALIWGDTVVPTPVTVTVKFGILGSLEGIEKLLL